MNERLTSALRGINRGLFWRDRACHDVMHDMADGLFWTEYRFLISASPDSGLTWAPHGNAERKDEYGRYSVYRYAPIWNPALYGLIPHDTSVRLGGVYLGTDKIAHFFPNGWRYYVELHNALDAGQSEDEAFETVLRFGIEQELGWFGMDFGTFSYADLESNWGGLRWYRAMCDDAQPLLVKGEDGWALREPFDITDWLNPCWDESFYGNAYTPDAWSFVERGLREYCAVREFPEVQIRFERYRARGCESRTIDRLQELVEAGEVPDPRPQSLDALCKTTRVDPP